MIRGPVSGREVFRARQERWKAGLERRHISEACLAAGFARPRNFAHNLFPFRAESHFLYLVGRHIEGSLLALENGEPTLYVQAPNEDSGLWLGPTPTLSQLERELEMRVRPIGSYDARSEVATLPPQDAETAEWLSSHVGRVVLAQTGAEVGDEDAILADVMVELRLVHDDAAILQLEYAAEVSAAAHRNAMQRLHQCEYEFQVRAEIESSMQRSALGPAYSSIVTVHGEILHNTSSSGRLRDGELLLCDAGAETAEGFAGDITRTWPVRGRFEGAARDAYEAVLAVQKEVLALVRPGVSFGDLHRVSCLSMAEQLGRLGILRGSPEGLVETGASAVFYPHGLGHLLGLDVHDMEDLGDRAGYTPGQERKNHPVFRSLRLDRVLERNMVVTIEPGFYVSPLLLARAKQEPKFSSSIVWSKVEEFLSVRGIRIEDDVCVTTEGSRLLSSGVPKECAEIEALFLDRSS
jgi:Xaa-Pro aminopeptidase